jgi:hypothetical protein
MRAIHPASLWRLFFLALIAPFGELVLSFPFFFAPGWANGWPGGLTIYRVWSTWLTITLFVILMTIGIGVGSLISLLACNFRRGLRNSGNVLATWMAVWTVLAVAACWRAFSEIYASTLEMWPAGYP